MNELSSGSNTKIWTVESSLFLVEISFLGMVFLSFAGSGLLGYKNINLLDSLHFLGLTPLDLWIARPTNVYLMLLY